MALPQQGIKRGVPHVFDKRACTVITRNRNGSTHRFRNVSTIPVHFNPKPGYLCRCFCVAGLNFAEGRTSLTSPDGLPSQLMLLKQVLANRPNELSTYLLEQSSNQAFVTNTEAVVHAAISLASPKFEGTQNTMALQSIMHKAAAEPEFWDWLDLSMLVALLRSHMKLQVRVPAQAFQLLDLLAESISRELGTFDISRLVHLSGAARYHPGETFWAAVFSEQSLAKFRQSGSSVDVAYLLSGMRYLRQTGTEAFWSDVLLSSPILNQLKNSSSSFPLPSIYLAMAQLQKVDEMEIFQENNLDDCLSSFFFHCRSFRQATKLLFAISSGPKADVLLPSVVAKLMESSLIKVVDTISLQDLSMMATAFKQARTPIPSNFLTHVLFRHENFDRIRDEFEPTYFVRFLLNMAMVKKTPMEHLRTFVDTAIEQHIILRTFQTCDTPTYVQLLSSLAKMRYYDDSQTLWSTLIMSPYAINQLVSRVDFIGLARLVYSVGVLNVKLSRDFWKMVLRPNALQVYAKESLLLAETKPFLHVDLARGVHLLQVALPSSFWDSVYSSEILTTVVKSAQLNSSSQLLYSLAKVNQDRPFYDVTAQLLQSEKISLFAEEASFQTFGLLLNAFAFMKFNPGQSFWGNILIPKVFYRLTKSESEKKNINSIAFFIKGVCAMGLDPGRVFWDFVYQKNIVSIWLPLEGSLNRKGTNSICDILDAMAQVGHIPSDIVGQRLNDARLACPMISNLFNFTVAQLFWSLAVLQIDLGKVFLQEFFQPNFTKQLLLKMSGKHLSTLLWSFAKLQLDIPQDFCNAIVADPCPPALRKVTFSNTNLMANTLWGFARLRLTPSNDFFKSWTERSTDSLQSFQLKLSARLCRATSLVTINWALSTLDQRQTGRYFECYRTVPFLRQYLRNSDDKDGTILKAAMTVAEVDAALIELVDEHVAKIQNSRLLAATNSEEAKPEEIPARNSGG